jgi:hypothetical protein
VELNKIAAMPVTTAEQSNGILVALEGLRADWKKRPVRPDLPEWRRAAESALDVAFDGVIRDLQRDALRGGVPQLDQLTLKKFLEPVFDELSTGLQRAFVEKFGKKPEPGAPPKKIEAADIAGALFMLFGPPPKKKP